MARARAARKNQWESFCKKGIQDAVVRVLSADGAKGLTMERVAREAGVAKGTLYVYFKDKKQLLQSVKEESMAPMRRELFGILDGDLPPVEKLRRFVLRHLSYFDEHREFFRVLLWERQIAETNLRRQQSDPFRTYVVKIAAVLREGARAKILRPLDPVKVAAVLIEADIAMIAQRLLMDSPGSVEEDARMLTDVILNGLSLKRTGPTRRT